MNKVKQKNQKVARRHKRVRAKIIGTAARPRLSVYRSLSHIYAQLIDDDKAKILMGASDKNLKSAKKLKKSDEAKEYFGVSSGQKVILIVGGSLGARVLNQSVLANLELIGKSGVTVIWQTGKFLSFRRTFEWPAR